MPDAAVPEARVLVDALLEAIHGDRLATVTFLSFQFAPQYFEDHILAPLCAVDSRGSPAIRRLLLEERLRSMDEVLVLFDPVGLEPDGPSRQRVRAVPVTWQRGIVHAKHALLLVEGTGKEGKATSALILLTTSANLTRTGWGQNVEVADIERIEADTATPLRDDLLALVAMMRTLEATGEGHPSLQRLEAFIRDRLTAAVGLPRLWTGQESLPSFLARHVDAKAGRMEVLAPFVDDDATPIAVLARAFSPAEMVVWFPRDRNDLGAALESWRQGVLAIPGARFGELPVDRTLGKGSNAVRFVHAKVVRIADPRSRQTWTLVGSPNLSHRGHAGWLTQTSSSNVETAILRVAHDLSRWLEPTAPGREPAPAEKVDAEDVVDQRGLPIRIRFDWETVSGALRLSGPSCIVYLGASTSHADSPAGAWVAMSETGDWEQLPPQGTDWLRNELETGNVIAAWSDEFPPVCVLVEEVGLAYRPSMVARELKPADILRHWALLSEAQRAANLEKRLDLAGEDPEAPVPASPSRIESAGPTMFDVFSGIIHGFLVLRSRMVEALDHHQDAAAEAWLLGARHDSLPTLLDKVLEETELDPVRQIVFALASRELLTVVKTRRPDLLAKSPSATGGLRERLARLEAAWDRIDDDATPGSPPGAYRRWIEKWWQGEVRP